ncbi:hypothetical protein FHP25_24895 [Vineibacter terrae]|uniref:Uncharacterized protein n=1 Tax=Vineibacter terrae TaxID=2586908 RepID=A0A5C8PFY5_9HYPH|nr:hypothetical protein [Vineibacter terrae]TXL72536.1 hypothetical protein FHP25_24895 [Vineibacter terrae]
MSVMLELSRRPADGAPSADAVPGEDVIRQRVADGLRLYVGTGRRYSMRAVGEATRIPEPTLKDYRSGAIVMPVSRFVQLAAVLPAGFADQVLAPAGLAVLDRAGERAADDHALAADVATALQGLAEALRDGRIDHRERAVLAPLARDIGQQLLAFAEGATS